MAQGSSSLDLLLKGGHVVDPANELDGVFDVGVREGKIARVEADILTTEATHVVDVSGLCVTPGLLDIHVHTYDLRWAAIHPDTGVRQPSNQFFSGSLRADAHFLKEGVTTCVDTGTAGADELEHFRRACIETSKVRQFAYVNIAHPGMGAPEQVVSSLDPKRAAEAAKEHADICVGIKTAHYWTVDPFDDGHPPWASVDNCVAAGDIAGVPVMIDFWPRPPERPYDGLILEHLRPGDIHTHVFARQFPIVDPDNDNKVYDHMWKARERGIHFDLGHGAASFWFRNAVPAFQQGFAPDSISTDLHMGNIHGHVHSMLDTMSKCMAMGMPFQEVIYRSTVTPARAIRHEELGTLSIGAEADIAVLHRDKGDFGFHDCGYGRLAGTERLECELTVRAGEVLWDRQGYTCPDWEEGGPEYFALPGTQAGAVPRLWRS